MLYAITITPEARWAAALGFAFVVALGLRGIQVARKEIRSEAHGSEGQWPSLGSGLLAYYMPGEQSERRRLEGDGSQIDRYQVGWSARANRSATYSSISLAIILVAAILLVGETATLTNRQEDNFRFVLLLAAVSVVLYGISLQFWEEALGLGYDVHRLLTFRTVALVLATTAWFLLMASLVMAIMVVHLGLGIAVALLSIAAALGTVEAKYRIGAM